MIGQNDDDPRQSARHLRLRRGYGPIRFAARLRRQLAGKVQSISTISALNCLTISSHWEFATKGLSKTKISVCELSSSNTFFRFPKRVFNDITRIFAQTVDGWVGDLAKVLAEIMAKWAIFLGQNRRWGIVAHRGQSFFAILCHWGQNLFQLFDAIASRDLAFDAVLHR